VSLVVSTSFPTTPALMTSAAWKRSAASFVKFKTHRQLTHLHTQINISFGQNGVISGQCSDCSNLTRVLVN
jgi:hypothetical protein